MPSSTEDKRGYLVQGFVTSEGEEGNSHGDGKADVWLKKKPLQGHQRQLDTEKNFNKQTLLDSFLFINLAYSLVTYGNSSLPGTGPLLIITFFKQEEGQKVSSWVFWALSVSAQNNPHVIETF